MRRLWLPVVLLLALGCRAHVQDEGTYAFTSTEIIRNDCGLVTGGLAFTGELSFSGDYVRIDTDLLGSLPGTSASSAPIQFIGRFLLREENFTADGSAGNVTLEASGQQCLVDLVNVHLEAVTDDPAHFHGTLRISYETRVNNGCTCQAWVSYTAVHQ